MRSCVAGSSSPIRRYHSRTSSTRTTVHGSSTVYLQGSMMSRFYSSLCTGHLPDDECSGNWLFDDVHGWSADVVRQRVAIDRQAFAEARPPRAAGHEIGQGVAVGRCQFEPLAIRHLGQRVAILDLPPFGHDPPHVAPPFPPCRYRTSKCIEFGIGATDLGVQPNRDDVTDQRLASQ